MHLFCLIDRMTFLSKSKNDSCFIVVVFLLGYQITEMNCDRLIRCDLPSNKLFKMAKGLDFVLLGILSRCCFAFLKWNSSFASLQYRHHSKPKLPRKLQLLQGSMGDVTSGRSRILTSMPVDVWFFWQQNYGLMWLLKRENMYMTIRSPKAPQLGACIRYV